ncbi:alpha/beta hydrolase [Roseibium sp. SCP14]|uniref:alpha/beta hydrolase n=1 Tax=Roseibium sp. SCP14 TaxID=3141375 RepID=UPI00333947EA
MPHRTPIANWDDAYSNARFIEGADDFPLRWTSEARKFRQARVAEGNARLDIPYGNKPRQKMDVFYPGAKPDGLFVFVHGGYWCALDKFRWSHAASGALEKGWAAALPSYTLCPEVTIDVITREIACAVENAAAQVSGPIVIVGHSAGGHLISRLLCRDSTLTQVAKDRIVTAVSISGVHDLRPLLKTSINKTLRLTEATAMTESPALQLPDTQAKLICWVGAEERPEFLRQNALLANIWSGFGVETLCVESSGEHHFNVVDGLSKSDSALMSCIFS